MPFVAHDVTHEEFGSFRHLRGCKDGASLRPSDVVVFSGQFSRDYGCDARGCSEGRCELVLRRRFCDEFGGGSGSPEPGYVLRDEGVDEGPAVPFDDRGE